MRVGITLFSLGMLLVPLVASSQSVVSLDEAVSLALERNPVVQAGQLGIRQQKALKGAVVDLPPTDVTLLYGQYNSIHRNDNNITVSQTIPFPSVFSSGGKLVKSRIAQAEQEARWGEAQLVARVRRKFNEVVFLKERQKLLHLQDSLFREMARVARVRYETGDGTQIERTTAEAQLMEVSNSLERNRIDLVVTLRQLAMLCVVDEIDVEGSLRNLIPTVVSDAVEADRSPQVSLQAERVAVAQQARQFELARALPSFSIGFFSQTLIGTQTIDGAERYFGQDDRFNGVQVGVSIPLFFNSANARVKSGRYAAEVAEKNLADVSIAVEQELLAVKESIRKNIMSVDYYEGTGLRNADLIVAQARRSFQEGEIEYNTLLMNLRQALAIREEYLNTLFALNDNIISLLQITEDR